MAVTLLQRELEMWDPLFFGVTPKGCACGVDLAAGLGGYMARTGLHLLYRGLADVGAIDYANPVGCVHGLAAVPGTIRNYAGYPFAPSSVYWLSVRAVSPGGVEEHAGTGAVRLETDGAGTPLAIVPNAPTRLLVLARAGGKFLLTWEHNPINEQTPPRSYNVYHDNAGGTVGGAAIASLSGRRFLTSAYGHGLSVKFRVRAVSRDGNEEPNTTDVSATAVADGPPAMGVADVEYGPEQ